MMQRETCSRERHESKCREIERVHEVLAYDQVAPLGAWMDDQLRELEARFAEFATVGYCLSPARRSPARHR